MIRSSCNRMLDTLKAVGLGVALAAPAFGEGVLEKPVPVRTPPPEYPMALRREGTKGLVVVKLQLGADGRVAGCEVTKSTHRDFNEPALKAVRRWVFKPAMRDGVAVSTEVMVPIQFALDS